MVSPHLLRPFSSRELSLVSAEHEVRVFAVLGGRYAGPTTLVHAPTLARRVDELPDQVATVVFIEGPVPDAATVALVDELLARFEEVAVDALALAVPATEAVKRVEAGRVIEGIDRSQLAAVRCPEVIRRPALQRSVGAIGDEIWVSTTALVAASGGVVMLETTAGARRARPTA